MNEVGKKDTAKPAPRFREYDCVVLKKNVKGTDLKKGDGGTIVDVWASGKPIAYEVDFDEKKITTSVLERHLKADPVLMPKQASTPAQPPILSDEVARTHETETKKL